jgi:hypothetical protein
MSSGSMHGNSALAASLGADRLLLAGFTGKLDETWTSEKVYARNIME